MFCFSSNLSHVDVALRRLIDDVGRVLAGAAAAEESASWSEKTEKKK
jgi:hypothetical protein